MGLGAGEIIVLLIIAYVVVGPEDTVKLARKLSAAMRQFRRMTAEVKTGLDDIGIDDVKIDGIKIDDIKINDIKINDSKTDDGNEDRTDPKASGEARKKSAGTGADSFRGDMESVMEEIRKAEQTIRF